MNLRTNVLSIEIKNSVEEAPNYNTNGQGFKPASILKALVIRNGTEAGKDTVDLQFEDAAGNKYVAMITGQLIRSLAQVIKD